MKRAIELKNKILKTTPSVCSERAYWFTESYKETEGDAVIIRRAKAFKKVLENMTIFIMDEEAIVGNLASTLRSAPIFPEFGVEWLIREVDDLPARTIEPFIVPQKTRSFIDDMEKYWRGKTHEDLAKSMLKEVLPEEIREVFSWKGYNINQAISCTGHMSTGDGHLIVNYERVIKEGLNKTIETAREKIAAFDVKLTDVEKVLFYKAIIIVCEAVIAFANRFAEEAQRLSFSKEISKERREELKEIAQTCRNVPANPAGSLREAVQSYWFIHLCVHLETNGHGISLGRFDQYLYPHYKADIESGKITREEALDMIECFMAKSNAIIKVREWAYTQTMSGFPMFQTQVIGGIDKEGNDAVNDVSYLTLESTADLQTPQPTTVVRWNEKTPKDFMRAAVKALIRHGGGLPSFFNDIIAIQILEDMGVPHEDANNWSIIGCAEAAVCGKFINITGGVTIHNLLKILEITLNNGCNPNTGLTMLPGNGGLEDFKNFDELLDAFKRQVEYYTKFTALFDNVTCKAYEMRNPTPFESALIDGRLDSAFDISVGVDDSSYHNITVQGHGAVNVGNCLAAVKKLVFDEKTISAKELKEALDSNFDGVEGERIRNILLNSVDKFGNDEDLSDLMAHDVIKFYTDLVQSFVPGRGGTYGATTQSLTGNIPGGAVVGATPDGRKAGTPFADNTSPMTGTDLHGPTAIVKSAAKLDHRYITNGSILNVKFHPSALQDDIRIMKFIDYVITYFKMGGYQIQFNVISRETLTEAKEHPEDYSTLVVKVAGYSALFAQLDERLQNQIIERTEHVI